VNDDSKAPTLISFLSCQFFDFGRGSAALV
jgi:hypothetical protein